MKNAISPAATLPPPGPWLPGTCPEQLNNPLYSVLRRECYWRVLHEWADRDWMLKYVRKHWEPDGTLAPSLVAYWVMRTIAAEWHANMRQSGVSYDHRKAILRMAGCPPIGVRLSPQQAKGICWYDWVCPHCRIRSGLNFGARFLKLVGDATHFAYLSFSTALADLQSLGKQYQQLRQKRSVRCGLRYTKLSGFDSGTNIWSTESIVILAGNSGLLKLKDQASFSSAVREIQDRPPARLLRQWISMAYAYQWFMRELKHPELVCLASVLGGIRKVRKSAVW